MQVNQYDHLYGYQFFKVRPLSGLIYVLTLVGLCAYFLHPLMLFVSFLFSILCVSVYSSKKALSCILVLAMPIILFSTVMGMFFNHSGASVLFYFLLRPVTVEAIVFGLFNGIMISSIIMWFAFFDIIVGESGVKEIFSDFLPTVSLSLSMSIRQLKKMKKAFIDLRDAQKVLGQGLKGKRFFGKLKSTGVLLSALLSHSLESGMTTAFSMRARGYGDGIKQKRKKSLRFKSFDRTGFRNMGKDLCFMVFFLGLLTALVILNIFCPLSMSFFPVFKLGFKSSFDVLTLFLYIIFCSLPISFESIWRFRWHLLTFKI